MWETPAGSTSFKERYEGWDCFTVSRFARFRHFHGPALAAILEFMYSRFGGHYQARLWGILHRMNLKALQF